MTFKDLIRRRAEHNDGLLSTLEEVTLHQQNIEKIEHLDKWCRELRIIYLQGNRIKKIENVGRLKKLEYLNLALNDIEVVENLQGCESLNKLDLTLNRIVQLTSLTNLQHNYALREVYLTGNPCSKYEGYRAYVIATLPQLSELDGQEITRGERIQAALEYNMDKIIAQERLEASKPQINYRENVRNDVLEVPPEVLEVTPPPKRVETIRNINELRIPFEFDEDDLQFNLTLHTFKYLDTSLIDVDLQPNYVTVTIKGKLFRLLLPTEVSTTTSKCCRSQITGYITITMDKVDLKKIITFKTPEEKSGPPLLEQL